jgi:hypothetical protein
MALAAVSVNVYTQVTLSVDSTFYKKHIGNGCRTFAAVSVNMCLCCLSLSHSLCLRAYIHAMGHCAGHFTLSHRTHTHTQDERESERERETLFSPSHMMTLPSQPPVANVPYEG